MNCTIDDRRYGTPPMPWIGNYVAAASYACVGIILVDYFYELGYRKLWLSLKCFPLNSTTMMLLSIATKLPTDISTPMSGFANQLAKLSGTALLSISISRFLPSLGSMEDSKVILNVVSLAILVITVMVNVLIQMGTGVIHDFIPHHIITLVFMLITLLITFSAALSITTMKQLLKEQHELKHRQVSCQGLEWSNEESVMATFTRLKKDARKCWLMALSSNPLYVIRRSCLGTASDIICILQAWVALDAFLSKPFSGSFPICQFSSDYKESIASILFLQMVAISVAALTSCVRTSAIGDLLGAPSKFNDILVKKSNGDIQVEKPWTEVLGEWKDHLIIGFKEFIKDNIYWIKRLSIAFKVERYWIQSFVEWKDNEIPLYLNLDLNKRIHIQSFINHIKNRILEVGRRMQILVVIFCKLVVHLRQLPLLVAFFSLIIVFFQALMKIIDKVLRFLSKTEVFLMQASFMPAKVLLAMIQALLKPARVLIAAQGDLMVLVALIPLEEKIELRNFVLHLEGEDGLVDWIYQCCCWKTKIRRSKQQYLLNLLKVSIVSQGFKGLVPLCCDHIQSAGSGWQGPPNFWALTLVTLTSIAAAIPVTNQVQIRSLLYGVSQGLEYVKLTEKETEFRRNGEY